MIQLLHSRLLPPFGSERLRKHNKNPSVRLKFILYADKHDWRGRKWWATFITYLLQRKLCNTARRIIGKNGGRVDLMAPRIFGLGTTWSWEVNFLPQQLFAPGNASHVPTEYEPACASDPVCFVGNKNLFHVSRMDLQFLGRSVCKPLSIYRLSYPAYTLPLFLM